MRFIGRLLCFVRGHKRAKRLSVAATPAAIYAPGIAAYQCQRCLAIWTRKVKA